jgi:hypothetical protein
MLRASLLELKTIATENLPEKLPVEKGAQIETERFSVHFTEVGALIATRFPRLVSDSLQFF